MIGFHERDNFKQTRKDLKLAVLEAEEYIENCSHSIGPRPGSDVDEPAANLKQTKTPKIKAQKPTKPKILPSKLTPISKSKASQSKSWPISM
jgi:hypothetical protein